MKLKPVVQQVVVVVGATSGIGLETARQFARKGARLVLAGRGQSDLEATLSDVRSEGAEAIIVEADVADWDQVNNIAQQAVDHFGRIDTWAHVAGVSFYAKIEDTSPEEFRRVIDVNLNGPAYGILAALPHIKREGRGAIIVVSSVDARIPLPYQGAYAAAKHGLDGLIDTLRLELKHDDIPVSITNILPATIDTPFFEKARTKIGTKPGLLPPVYSARSVADAIVYAAENPMREISIGSAAVTYQAMHRLSRRMFDRMVGTTMFKAQKTDNPRTVQYPNHLYEHLEGHHDVSQENVGMYSKYTWLQIHPAVRTAVMGLLIGLPVGYLIYRGVRGRRMQNQSFLARAAEMVGISAFIANLRRKSSLPSRVGSTVREAIPENLFGRRKASLPRRVTSTVREALPENLFSRREQSFPRKVMSKAQDIFPKIGFLSRETFPEKVAKRAKEMLPKQLNRRKATLPAKVASRLRRAMPDVSMSDMKDTVTSRVRNSRPDVSVSDVKDSVTSRVRRRVGDHPIEDLRDAVEERVESMRS